MEEDQTINLSLQPNTFTTHLTQLKQHSCRCGFFLLSCAAFSRHKVSNKRSMWGNCLLARPQMSQVQMGSAYSRSLKESWFMMPQWIKDRHNEMSLEEARGEEKESAVGRLRVSCWQKEINHSLRNADVINKKNTESSIEWTALKRSLALSNFKKHFYNFH